MQEYDVMAQWIPGGLYNQHNSHPRFNNLSPIEYILNLLFPNAITLVSGFPNKCYPSIFNNSFDIYSIDFFKSLACFIYPSFPKCIKTAHVAAITCPLLLPDIS